MRLQIEPFTESQLDAAATLLVARYRADREREPALSARFEGVSAVRDELKDLLAAPGTTGVVALRNSSLAGYLIGRVELLSDPLSVRALIDPPRMGRVVSHAVSRDGGTDAYRDTYRELYAAIAPGWLAAGCFSHHIGVRAADQPALDAWFSLGFGQSSTHGLRDTGPVAEQAGGTVQIRQAGPGDLDAVFDQRRALFRYLAGPPMYAPYFPETETNQREDTATMLRAEANVCWLAERDGRVAGMMLLGSPTWRAVGPERCIFLYDGYAEASDRGRGVGTALLARAMAGARAQGYDWCLLNFVAGNLLGARFWLGSGFRPLTYFLERRLDERIAWANGAV